MRSGLDGAAVPMTLRSNDPDRAVPHKAHDTDTRSINDGSLFFTFPTRLSTGHMVICSAGYGPSNPFKRWLVRRFLAQPM
jgi:hypothetical protein